jgi:hypothetical protein
VRRQLPVFAAALMATPVVVVGDLPKVGKMAPSLPLMFDEGNLATLCNACEKYRGRLTRREARS